MEEKIKINWPIRAGMIFLFLLVAGFQASTASADWGRKLTMSEMSGIYAQGITFKWHMSMGFGDLSGRFRFNFGATGTVQGKKDDFQAGIGLLGGLMNVSAGTVASNSQVPADAGPTSPSKSLNFSGEGGFASVTFGGSVSNPGQGASPASQMNLSFGGPNQSAGQSLVSFVGADFSSNVNINLQMIDVNQNPVARLEIIRSAICGGCR